MLPPDIGLAPATQSILSIKEALLKATQEFENPEHENYET